MKKQYKEFNLKEALQNPGNVVNKAGQEVTELAYFKTRACTHKLLGIVNGQLRSWTDDGRFNTHGAVSVEDLEMYTEVQVCYVNVYKASDGKLHVGPANKTKEQAISSICAPQGYTYIKTIEITEQTVEDVSNDDDTYNELGQNDIDGLMRYVIKNLTNS